MFDIRDLSISFGISPLLLLVALNTLRLSSLILFSTLSFFIHDYTLFDLSPFLKLCPLQGPFHIQSKIQHAI